MTDWKSPLARKLAGGVELLKAINREEDAAAHMLVAAFAEANGCKNVSELEANLHDASTVLAALRKKKRKPSGRQVPARRPRKGGRSWVSS